MNVQNILDFIKKTTFPTITARADLLALVPFDPYVGPIKWLGFTDANDFLARFLPNHVYGEPIDHDTIVAELRRLIHKHWFDKAYAGLEAQGWEKSTIPNSRRCQYYSKYTNRRCAIGHMIDPTAYRPAMDLHQSWILEEFNSEGMLLGLTQEQFDAIQEMHDLSRSPLQMKAKFDAYRAEHNLS